MFNNEEKSFYNKHLLLSEIGYPGQLLLKKAKVLVVGAGGLGCPVLSYLCGAGVGVIGIIDGDKIDISNLQRQVLYSYDETGQFKAQTAADKLRKSNPFIEFRVFNENLSVKNTLWIIESFDIIVDATDNFPTRYLINDACVQLDKPFVFASIDKFQGQLSVFNFKQTLGSPGPTYRCVFPEPPSPKTAANCSELGVLGVLPGVLGALQANEVIKIICSSGSVLSGEMLIVDLLKMTFYSIKIQRDNKAVSEVVDLKNTPQESIYENFCSLNSAKLLHIDPLEIDKLQGVQFVDVREEGHFRGLDNSIKIPASQIMTHTNLLSSKKNIVLYCDYGITSQKAASELIGLGRENIYNLQGGLQRWYMEKHKTKVI